MLYTEVFKFFIKKRTKNKYKYIQYLQIGALYIEIFYMLGTMTITRSIYMFMIVDTKTKIKFFRIRLLHPTFSLKVL